MTDKEKILQTAASTDVNNKLLAYMTGVVRGLVSWDEYFGAALELLDVNPANWKLEYEYKINDFFFIDVFTYDADEYGGLSLGVDLNHNQYISPIIQGKYYHDNVSLKAIRAEAEQAIKNNLPKIQVLFCEHFKLPNPIT